MKKLIALFVLAGCLFTGLAQAAGTVGALAIPPAPGREYSAYFIAAPTYTDALVLSANTSVTQAIPSGAHWVVLSGACNFFAILGAGPAVVPGSTTTDGTAAMQNPSAWYIPSGTTQISVIAASTCIVTLSFWQ